MPLTIITTKHTHPFAAKWAETQKILEKKRVAIMQRTGWQRRTFYTKLAAGLEGTLVLTETEAEAIAEVMEVPLDEISDYQTSKKK